MPKESTKVNADTKIKITRYDSGEVEYKTPYVNGKKHGVETMWDESGQKLWEIMWVDDKRHGMETQWDENGRKWYEKMWRHEIEHGMETGWYQSGRKYYETMLINHEKYAQIHWDGEGNVVGVNIAILIKTKNQKQKNHINQQIS